MAKQARLWRYSAIIRGQRALLARRCSVIINFEELALELYEKVHWTLVLSVVEEKLVVALPHVL